MSHSLPYTSAPFYLQKVSHIAPAVVRVRFTYVPKSANPSADNDGTNPFNYTITGPKAAEVVSVSKVDSDPQSLDVFLNVPLSAGIWTITASNEIQAFDDNANLTTPNSVSFAAAITKTKGPVNGGALSDSAASIIRKHLPPSFAGPAWDAVIEGLSLGDAANWENAQAAFEQLFISTAAGSYLDRRAGDVGVTRPSAVGMADEAFRQYAVRTSAEKLTINAILQILEAFYGSDAVRARMETRLTEPYRLEDEDTIFIGVDGIPPAEFVFNKSDFAIIGKATAVEVAAALNKQFRDARFPAFAGTRQDPQTLKSKVVVYSASLGLSSSVTAFGGFANNSLQFPDIIDLAIGLTSTIDLTPTIDISKPAADVARLHLVGHDQPAFAELQEGDCVNIWGDGFNQANRGTFTILDVGVEWTGNSWSQYFDIRNDLTEPQQTVIIYDTDDLVFFRPVRNTASSKSGVIVSQTQDGVHVVMPATTTVVQRDEFTGAHPNGVRPLEIETISVDSNGVATVTTTENHLLSAGDKVQIAEISCNAVVPAKSGGSTSLTSYSPFSATDTFAFPAGFVFAADSAVASIGNGRLLVCGADKSVKLTILASGGANTGHFDVQWQTPVTMSGGLTKYTATVLSGDSVDAVLIVGGKTTTGVSDTAYSFDSADSSWTGVVDDESLARYSHTTTRLLDNNGNETLLIYGGKTVNTQLASGAVSYLDGVLSPVAALSSDGGRFGHAAVAASDNTALIAGGSSLDDVFSTTFAYNAATGTVQSCGKLSIARKDFSLVKLPSGLVMAVGGLGRNLSNETTNRAIAECEVWEPSSRSWRSAGRLHHARVSPVVALIGKHVYVMGGTTGAGAPVTATERYDASTGKWSVLLDIANTPSNAIAFGAASGSILVGLSQAGASVLMARTPTALSPVMHDTFSVVTNLGPKQFTVNVPANSSLSATGGSVVVLKAPEAAVPGPYAWEPTSGFGITAVEGTLASPVFANQKYQKLTLASEQALSFPDEPGWICINAGTDQVIGPIPYIGRLSDSELMIDYNFKFTGNAISGSKVTLLSGKGAFVPARPEHLGSLYLTASSSGRVVAQTAIENALAAGVNERLHLTVTYPGDKGLGNAGQGTTGQKVSDKVSVWGGNDLDSELAEAREEE